MIALQERIDSCSVSKQYWSELSSLNAQDQLSNEKEFIINFVLYLCGKIAILDGGGLLACMVGVKGMFEI